MDTEQKTETRRDFIRAKHRAICQQYIDLVKKETEENQLRAKHIGKVYYAQVIAQSMNPTMNWEYVLKIINQEIHNHDKRD